MVNVTYVVPRILSFRQVLNEIVEARAVRTPNGDATQLSNSKPYLTVGVGYTDPSGDINGGESYTFAHESGELTSVGKLITAAGVDVVEAWNKAFDAAKELFDKTKDQPDSAKVIGVAWHMRVDVVEASLNPTSAMGIRLIIGCYKDAAFTKVASTFEIGFHDSATMLQRSEQIKQLKANIIQLQDMVAGIHIQQHGMTGDALADSKTRAASDLTTNQGQLARMEAALAAPMSMVLGLPEVQTAFGAVAQAVFTELQSKLPEWKDIQVAEVMKFFGPAMLSVAIT